MKKIIGILLLVMTAFSAYAADQEFLFRADRTSLTSSFPNVYMKKLTVKVHVGDCVSVTAMVDSVVIPVTYTASTKQAMLNVESGNDIYLIAHGYTGNATGAITKANLYNDKKWAYSITFDDNLPSVYHNGWPILKAKGYRGGVSVNSADMEEDWETYNMSWEELDELYYDGWGVFNHSATHPHITCANVATDILLCKQALEARYPAPYKNTHFVFPFNDTTDWTCVRDSGYFYSAENVGGNNTAYPAPAERFLLKRYFIGGVNYSAFNAFADAAAATAGNAWLIGFTHGVVPGSSIPSSNDTNETALSTHINYIYNTYGAGGADNMWVAPTDEVMHYILSRDNTTFAAATPSASVTPIIPTETFTRTNTPTKSITYTPTETPTFTATSDRTPGGAVFDDFEDNNFTDNLWGGAYNDYASYGSYVAVSAASGSAPQGTYFGRMQATVIGPAWSAFGNTCYLQPSGGEMDLRAYSGIKLYMRGNYGTGTPVMFMIQIICSTILDYSQWRYIYYPSGTWSLYTIPWSSFSKPTWGTGSTKTLSDVLSHVTAISYIISDAAGAATSSTGNLWEIDNVQIMAAPTETPTATADPTVAALLNDKKPLAFPNPGNGEDVKIRFEADSPADTYKILIYTYSMRLVHEFEAAASCTGTQCEVTIPAEYMETMAKGMYYAVIEAAKDGRKEKSRKVIIIK